MFQVIDHVKNHSLIYTLLGYNNTITLTTKLNRIMSVILGSLFFLLTSLMYTKTKLKNGFLHGLLLGTIIISIIIIIKLFTKTMIPANYFIKYAVYIFASIIGGIIGINRQNKKWYIVSLFIFPLKLLLL